MKLFDAGPRFVLRVILRAFARLAARFFVRRFSKQFFRLFIRLSRLFIRLFFSLFIKFVRLFARLSRENPAKDKRAYCSFHLKKVSSPTANHPAGELLATIATGSLHQPAIDRYSLPIDENIRVRASGKYHPISLQLKLQLLSGRS